MTQNQQECLRTPRNIRICLITFRNVSELLKINENYTNRTVTENVQKSLETIQKPWGPFRKHQNTLEPQMNLSEPTETPQISPQRNMTHQKVHKSLITTQNTLELLRLPYDTPKLQRISQTSRCLSEPKQRIRMPKKILLHQWTPQNLWELLRTSQNPWEHLRTLQNVEECFKT